MNKPIFPLLRHPLQPWLTIWIKPRQTIRQIVDRDPFYQFWILIICFGFVNALGTASSRNFGDTIPNLGVILLMCAILGPMGATFSIFVVGGILHFVGRQLGGLASGDETRAALLWSSIPQIMSILLFPPQYLLFGFEFFTGETPKTDALIASSPVFAFMFTVIIFGVLGIGILISIWNTVIFIACLSEVNQFSTWRAIVTTLIPIAGLVALAFCVISQTN